MIRYALLSVSLAACAQGGGNGDTTPAPTPPAPPPAITAMVSTYEVDISVADANGAAIPAVRISIEDTGRADPDRQVYETFAQGLTDPEGHLRTSCRIPQRADHVDVVVITPGHVGPWTDGDLKTALGPTATAARVRIRPTELNALNLTLTPQ